MTSPVPALRLHTGTQPPGECPHGDLVASACGVQGEQSSQLGEHPAKVGVAPRPAGPSLSPFLAGLMPPLGRPGRGSGSLPGMGVTAPPWAMGGTGTLSYLRSHVWTAGS